MMYQGLIEPYRHRLPRIDNTAIISLLAGNTPFLAGNPLLLASNPSLSEGSTPFLAGNPSFAWRRNFGLGVSY